MVADVTEDRYGSNGTTFSVRTWAEAQRFAVVGRCLGGSERTPAQEDALSGASTRRGSDVVVDGARTRRSRRHPDAAAGRSLGVCAAEGERATAPPLGRGYPSGFGNRRSGASDAAIASECEAVSAGGDSETVCSARMAILAARSRGRTALDRWTRRPSVAGITVRSPGSGAVAAIVGTLDRQLVQRWASARTDRRGRSSSGDDPGVLCAPAARHSRGTARP